MDKVLGILPYVYFEELVKLGNVTFLGLPDWKGRSHAPVADSDKRYLGELSACFSTTRGLSTNRGAIKAMTYFLLNTKKGKEAQALQEARKAVSLLRYTMLSPNTQALDNVESTYTYAFALPPAGHSDYRLYQCWPNLNIEQEIWISPKHQKFPLPSWYVDLQLIHTSQLEDVEEINQRFHGQETVSEEDAIILAIEWYNQSFLKYTLRGVAGRLVDVATAFETLFQLPKYNKTAEFKNRIRRYLGAQEGSILDNWATDFYSKVRSETVHKGKPLSYLFKHPEAQEAHLSFLWSAQRIFRECVAIKAGLERKLTNDRLIEELTPNEVILKRLRNMGSYENIKKAGALWEVWKLRQIYPVGERDDIVWLGKILLGEMVKRPVTKNLTNLSLVVMSILNTKDDDEMLGWKYYQLMEQLKGVFNQDDGKGVKDLAKAFDSAYLVRHFTEFAGYALTTLYHSQKQKRHRL